MAEMIEYRSKYKAVYVVMPGMGNEEVSLGVTYDEDSSEWQDGNEGEVDISRNFLLDCSKEKAIEIISCLTENRFFWYDRYPKYYKAEWKKQPKSFWARIRRRIYKAWSKKHNHSSR